MTHLILHFAVPVVIAFVAYRPAWRSAAAVMIGTMLVDLDHLLADPIYDPARCSIGFHPLHGSIPIVVYLLLACAPLARPMVDERGRARLRMVHLVGVGLVIHMALDALDCVG